MNDELIFNNCETKDVGSFGIQLPITTRPPGLVTRTISLATSTGLRCFYVPNTERVKSNDWSLTPCRLHASPSLKVSRLSPSLRGSFVSGTNEVRGNVDSNNFRPQTCQRNRRGAIAAAKVQGFFSAARS